MSDLTRKKKSMNENVKANFRFNSSKQKSNEVTTINKNDTKQNP